MSGARFLFVAASVAFFPLPWTSALAPAATLHVDEAAGQAIENNPTQAPPGGPDTGGETMGTATVIQWLPYSDSGNTCGHLDDYTPACAPSTAPDLVYRYTPAVNMVMSVSLCGSTFDTILHIYANNIGTPVGCNDDFCGLQSEIHGVTLSPGNTYYFVIDGYSTTCGAYVLNIVACGNCVGACCLPSGCVITNPGDCERGGGVYQGGPTCDPDPCAATPVEAVTWGRIKSAYRGASE